MLIAATRNPAKIGAFRRALPTVPVDPFPAHVPLPDDDETGVDMRAIASAKAVAGSRALGDERLVIASDGGLLVPGLGEAWDPLRTRRFAGIDADDFERAQRLLAMTAHLAGEQRRVGWFEAVAIARGGAVVGCWEAEGPPGILTDVVDADLVRRGGGFWVQAIWIAPECGGRRLAELERVELARRRDYWTALGELIAPFLANLPPA